LLTAFLQRKATDERTPRQGRQLAALHLREDGEAVTATHAKFFERNGKLLLEIHHGEPEKTCLERKATACDRETFKAEYGIYKSTGGKL
jgi:hypothetical protein